jgi:hypothetical protein
MSADEREYCRPSALLLTDNSTAPGNPAAAVAALRVSASLARAARCGGGKENVMSQDKTPPVTELVEQAMKNYEQALKTGLRVQEESARWCAGLLNQTLSPQDWQRKMKGMADDVLPQTQKSVEESLKLIEKNSRMTLELLKKASAAAQSATPQEAQTRFLNLWEASITAIRETAQTVAQANTKALDSWMEFVRKTAEPEGKAKA